MRPPTWEQLELAERLRARRNACCAQRAVGAGDGYKPPEEHFLGVAPWFWPPFVAMIGIALLMDYSRGKGLWSKK